MEEGRSAQHESEMGAVLGDHEGKKSHHIGKAFASAHGKDHQGGLGGVQAGPSAGPENNDAAGEFGSM